MVIISLYLSFLTKKQVQSSNATNKVFKNEVKIELSELNSEKEFFSETLLFGKQMITRPSKEHIIDLLLFD